MDILKVKHIVVCGHHGCGGVRAVIDKQQLGLVTYWLNPLAELAQQHAAALEAIEDVNARANHLCDLSVRRQVQRLAATPIVQAAWARGQALKIHGTVYNLGDGLMTDLQCTEVGKR